MRATSSLANVKLLALFNFFNDFRLFGPILVIYFADVSGSFALGGLIFATIMVSSALLEIPTGVLSDRLPRTKVAMLGALATALGVVAYALAPGIEILLVGAVLEGLGRALFSGNNEALLWDSLAEHGRENEYPHHYGRVNAGFQIALAISAIIGGFIGDWSMRWAVALSILPQFACLFTALLMCEPKTHHNIEPARPLKQIATATRTIMRHKRLRRLTFASALSHGSGEAGWQFQPAFIAMLWPTWAVGIGRGINHATSIAGFWFAGRVIKRFGAARTLFGGSMIMSAIGLVAIGKPTVASPAFITTEGAMFGLVTTSKGALSQGWFTDAERATMGSIGAFLGSMLFGLFAIAAGLIADRFGPQAALLTCHIAGMASIPVYWWLQRSESS